MLSRHVLLLAVALAIAALCHAGSAGAHAVLVESSPAPGATVDGPALAVELRFNLRVDHMRSTITLVGPDGRETAVAVAKDGVPAQVMAGKTGELAPGNYRLRWQVLAIDGHITRGDVRFTVRDR